MHVPNRIDADDVLRIDHTKTAMKATRTLRARGFAIAIVAAIFLLTRPVSVSADQLTLSIDPSSQTVAAGGTGSFTIDLSNASTNTSSFTVGGFQLEMSVPTASGITFTSASIPTTGYLFQGNSFDIINSQPFSNSTFPTTSVTMADAANTLSTSPVLAPGDSFALAVVNFSVSAAAASGTFAISNIDISTDPSFGTQFTDNTGSPLTYSYAGGSITVQGKTVVPEPASIVLACLGCTGGYGFLRASSRKIQLLKTTNTCM